MFNPVKCSRLPAIFAVLCIFGLTCLIASGGEPEILLLTSDGGNHPLSVQLFDKLSALGEVTPLPLDIDGDSTAQKANESLAKFHKTQPLASYDLIVAVDDPAIEALLAEVPDSSQLPPVLIANYRGMPMRFKEKHPNFTGFGGPAYLPQMLDWALKCYPETTRAVIIVDDLPGERDTIPILHAQLNNYQRCDTEIWSGKELSSQTVLEKVQELPPDSVILLGPWHRAKRDGISSDEKFIQEMAQSSARPIFAVDPYWIGRGALGGYVSGNEIICEDTTALAKRILQGENITKFPVYLMPVECILDGNVFLASRLRFDALPVNPLWINPPFAEHFRWDWYHALAALLAGALLTLLVMRKLSEPQRSQLAAAKDQINHLASDLLELHRTIDSVPDSLIVTDTKNRIKLVNAAAARMTGYVKEELTGQRIEDFCKLYDRFNHKTVHPKTAEVMKSNRRMIIPEHVDLQNRKGDKIHVSELASPIRISGSVAGSVLVLRDLTLDIQQKDQLEVSGKLLSIVGPMCKLSWARLDSEHKLIDTNGTKVTNWPFDANGNHIPAEKWIHPEDLAAFNQIWHDIKNSDKKLLTLNYRALSENGDLRYFAMNICQVVASEFGTIQYLVVIQDITEFGVAERKTRESLQMLQTIIANAPVGIALKDADDEFRYVFWNEAIKKYIDADQNSLAGLTDFDMPYYKEYGQRARIQDEQVMACGKLLISDEKRIHRDQTESIYHMVKQPVILESGKRYLLAVLVDFTHERHLETQLQQSIQQLQQLLRQEEIYNRSLRQLILTESYESAVQSLVNEIGGSSGAIACFAVGFETDETKSLRCWWHDGQSRLPEQLFEQLAQRTNTDLEQILQNRDATLRLTAKDTGIENVDTTLYPVIDRGKFLGICGLCDVATATPMNRCELLQTFSGLLLVARERAVQNRNLDISQQMRKMIFNNLRVPIMLFDAEGNLLNFNPASLKITGLTEEEIWKNPCYASFCKLSGESPRCPMRTTQKTLKSSVSEIKIDKRTFIVSSDPIFDHNGKLVNILESAIDITEITESKRQLTEAMRAAQAANRAKTNFIATMNHELRTPLNSVIGYSDLLMLHDIPPDEQDRYHKAINNSSKVLLNLIDDVLTLAQSEDTDVSLMNDKCDINTLFAELANLFQPIAREQDIRFSLTQQAGMPLLYMDLPRLRKILLNIIGNAMKFTRQGTVTVYAAYGAITAKSGTLTLTVRDTGIGIRPEFLPHVFEPFAQDEQVRGSRAYQGSGLGLAIAKKLVDDCGGEIVFDSRLGEGSCVTIRFSNLRISSTHQSKDTTTQPLVLHKSKRFLLVDDLPMNLKILEAILKKLGIATSSATSGVDALALLQTEHFDVMITDIWMPEMNGIELAEQAREIELKNPAVKLYALTADAEWAPEQAELFDGIVYKPIKLNDIVEIVNSLSQETPKSI